MLVVAAVNATEQRLPNILTVGAEVFALVAALVALSSVTILADVGSPSRAAAGGAILRGWIMLGALLVRGGYWLGDVKLAAACGVLAGWLSWMVVSVAVLVTQVAIAVLLLHAKARGRQRAALGPAFAACLLAAVIATGL